MVCLLSNRKKRVSRNWIRGINFSLIEDEQPNFYAENIPFSCNYLLAVLRPSSSLVLRRFDFFPPKRLSFVYSGRISKSSYQNATSGSIVECSNLHARQRVDSCDVKHDSRSRGCEFDLPNRTFLCPWSHFIHQTYSCTLWSAECVISLATDDLKSLFYCEVWMGQQMSLAKKFCQKINNRIPLLISLPHKVIGLVPNYVYNLHLCLNKTFFMNV